MEGILIAIISGLFSLAGIWLKHYLDQSKASQQVDTGATRGIGARAPVRRRVKGERKPRKPVKAGTEEFVFFKASSWWFLTALLLGICTGGALLARWIVNYAVELLNLADSVGEIGWLPVIVAGLAWGLVYATVGGIEASELIETLFQMFDPYDDLFGPADLSDFIRGLFTAFPINVLLAAIFAVGLGILAITQFQADFNGVAHLTFGIVSFLEMLWFSTYSLM